MNTITRETLHQTIDELPDSALGYVAHFLTWVRRQWPVQQMPVVPGVVDTDDPTRLSGRERRARIHAEAIAWRAFPETVRRAYGDAFVAVYNQEVIDHDPDRLTIYRRVRKKLGDVPVLITPANAPSPREIRVLTPRFERVS